MWLIKFRNVFTPHSTLKVHHQVELPEHVRMCIAFEADERLYQFTRLPFGLKMPCPVFSA